MRLPRPTPLQEATRCAFECMDEAREYLSDDAYAAFVWVLYEIAKREAGRLAYGEALRATRDEGGQ